MTHDNDKYEPVRKSNISASISINLIRKNMSAALVDHVSPCLIQNCKLELYRYIFHELSAFPQLSKRIRML